MRVEKNQDVKKELAKTKRELSSEIRRETKQGHPLLTCGIIAIVLILVLASWIGVLVAKTGFVEVPVLTDAFYEVPQPDHVVVGESASVEQVLSEELTELVTARVIVAGGTDIDRSVELDLSEQAFSATLRNTIINDESSTFDSDLAQIAITSRAGLEVYAPLKDNDQDSAIRLTLMPSVSSTGVLEVAVTSLTIGNLELPGWLVQAALTRPIQIAVGELNKAIAQFATLNSLAINDGYLTLKGQLASEIIKIQY